MTKRVLLRSALCLALLLALVAVYLPAAAQDAGTSWQTTSDLGTVGISSPAAGETIAGEVSIEGTATSTRFAYYKVEFSVDGENWVTVGADYEQTTAVSEGELDTWDTTAVANGQYWLRAVVVDNTGNFLASAPVAVTVANEAAAATEATAEATAEATTEATAEATAEATPAAAAPGWLTTGDSGTVGISSPAAGEALSGEVDVMGTATNAPEKFSYYKVEYSADGSAWVTVDTDYEHKTTVIDDVLATWDTTAVADGSYWLRAVIVDNTGNFTASEPVAVTVANGGAEAAPAATEAAAEATTEATAEATAEAAATEAAPAAPGWQTVTDVSTVGISAPAAGETISGVAEISGVATSNRFAYYKVEYSVDGENWVTVDADYENTTMVSDGVLDTWDTTTVANGQYWLRAVVVDNTGNFVASAPVAVTVANEAAAES